MTYALISIVAFIVFIAVLTALGSRRRSGRASPQDSGGDGSFFLFTSSDSGSTISHHCGDMGGSGGDCGGGHH